MKGETPMNSILPFRTTAWLTGLVALLLAGCIPMPAIPSHEGLTVCDESTYPADKDGVVKKHSVCRSSTKRVETTMKVETP